MTKLIVVASFVIALATEAGGMVWDWQCDVDPTTIDNDGDGNPDWATSAGAVSYTHLTLPTTPYV